MGSRNPPKKKLLLAVGAVAVAIGGCCAATAGAALLFGQWGYSDYDKVGYAMHWEMDQLEEVPVRRRNDALAAAWEVRQASERVAETLDMDRAEVLSHYTTWLRHCQRRFSEPNGMQENIDRCVRLEYEEQWCSRVVLGACSSDRVREILAN